MTFVVQGTRVGGGRKGPQAGRLGGKKRTVRKQKEIQKDKEYM